MEAARQIRQFNESPLIVFVTGFADFVFEGYQVRALDYLLKPVEETRLEAVLSSARKALAQSEEDYLCIRNAEGIYRIRRNEILYCYSDRRKVSVVKRPIQRISATGTPHLRKRHRPHSA